MSLYCSNWKKKKRKKKEEKNGRRRRYANEASCLKSYLGKKRKEGKVLDRSVRGIIAENERWFV